MNISHATRVKRNNPTNGYGYATDRMIDSLTRLGHEVKQNDPTADVQIWFDQPHHWTWNQGQYRVGYLPWESTKLKPGWAKAMNETDEIWTPSPLIAEWFANDGIKVPIYVYEHGVDKVWTPKPRAVDDKIRFLHVGAEAARKGGMEVMTAFRTAFPHRTDVSLTLKMINDGWNIPSFGKIEIINRTLRLPELVDLFHNHHAYVYPSWGEGFGLTPIQAMATGMPTITLPAWAPYERFLDPRLSVGSTFTQSQWRPIHPGKMFMPKMDEVVDRMRWVADNYEDAHRFALDQSEKVRADYDWDDLTKNTFSRLEKRLKF